MRNNIISIILLIAIGGTFIAGLYLSINVVPGKPLNIGPPLFWLTVSGLIVGLISGTGVYLVEKRSQTPEPVKSRKNASEQTSQRQQQKPPTYPSTQPTSSQPDVAANFGRFLRSEINRQGLLPSRVARQAGVSENQLMLWASGEEIPSTQQYISLRDAFNLPPEQHEKWEEFLPAIHFSDPESKKQ